MIPILRILRGGARRGIFGEGPVKKITMYLSISNFENFYTKKSVNHDQG